MTRFVVVSVCYALVSLLVTVIWTREARTEFTASTSIVANASGTGLGPFVRRRLLPDAARLLAASLPTTWWEQYSDFMTNETGGPAILRDVMHDLRWQPAHYPLLISAHVLIWFSVFGFMYTCRWLGTTLYHCPQWVAELLGILFGIALLGGNGDRHYRLYPYDFPNAFVFTLTLAAMLNRRWWYLICFAAATYSKETSILLIIAFMLLNSKERSSCSAFQVIALVAIYVSVICWIRVNFIPQRQAEFWYPMRNMQWLGRTILFDHWYLPVIGVAILRMICLWPRFPWQLRRLFVLIPLLLAVAFFKGWIEERRQYLEVCLPILGLMVMQWLTMEFGLTRFFRPKESVGQDPSDEKPFSGTCPSSMGLQRSDRAVPVY